MVAKAAAMWAAGTVAAARQVERSAGAGAVAGWAEMAR